MTPHSAAWKPTRSVWVSRVSDDPLPADVVAAHDALIAAYVRKLEASTTGLIETYLARWARGVREVQTDPASGLVIQRLDARTGFALAPLRAFGHPEAFTRVYRRPNPRVRALPRSPERGSRNARRAPRVS